MIVFVHGEHFAVEVRHEQARTSIIIEIGGVHAHAGARQAAITVSNAGNRGDLIEFSLATIDEKKISNRVVAYPQVDQSVVVDIGRDHAPYLAKVTGDARLLADVGERAIAIVVEQPAGHGRINFGDAIVMAAVIMDSAGFVEFLAEIHEAPYEKIKAAVIVVVKPDGTGSPTGSGDSRFFGYVGKRAVAVVVIKDAAAVLRDIKIRKTVAVVVPNRDALAKAARGHTGFFSYVGERAVAIVPIQSVSQRQVRIEKIALAAVYQGDVHPAVVVIIQKCAACS